MIASRLLWLAVLAPSIQQDGRLTVGDSLQGVLPVDAAVLDGQGAAVRHELVVSASGWVTITLHSLDFDAHLRLERANGELLAEDDDGGPETDARITAQLEAGASYRLTAGGAQPGAAGEYELTAGAGRPEKLTRGEELDVWIEFRTKAAERARERGRLSLAAEHLLELGSHQLLRAQLEAAIETWEGVRSLATELGDANLDARAMGRLSEALGAAGQHARAREVAEEALAVHVHSGDLFEEAIAVRALATAHHVIGEHPRSIELFERLEEIAAELDNRHMLGQALYGMATSLQYQGNGDEAEERLEEAREIFHETGDPSGEARVLNSIALASDWRGDDLQARDQFEAAVELFRESGDQGSEAMALANLGHTYYKMGAFQESLATGHEALGMAESVGFAHGMQWALSALGNTYQSLGDFPRALENHTARLEMVEDEGNIWAASWANLGMAKALTGMGRLDEALQHLDTAQTTATTRGDRKLLGSIAGARATAFFFRWDFSAARAEYESQLSAGRQLGERKTEASALGGIAICDANLGDYEQARELLEQALWIYDEIGDNTGVLWVRSNQADVLRNLGELRLAEEAYEEVIELGIRLRSPINEPHTRMGLGRVLHDMGDFSGAQEQFDRARLLAQARADSVTTLRARLMLVDLRVHFGDFQAAMQGASACLEQARARRATGEHRQALELMGTVEMERGDLAAAREFYEQALNLDVGSSSLSASAITNLGLIHLMLGEVEQGGHRFQQRLELARENGSASGEAWALNGLSIVASELGNAERGRELALEAYEISRKAGALDVRQVILLTLVEQDLKLGDAGAVRRRLRETERLLSHPTLHAGEATEVASQRNRSFRWARIAEDLTRLELESAGDRSAAQRRAIEDGFVRLGQWKSRGLLEGIVEHRRGARSQEAMRVRQERRTAQLRRDHLFERMGARLAAGGSGTEIDELRGQADAAWARADELGERLVRVSPRDGSLDLPRGVGPEAVRRHLLDDETVVIEYSEGLEDLYAYVISTSQLNHVNLGSRTDIAASTLEFLAAVSSPSEVPLNVLAERGRKMHELLLSPALATLDESPTRLVILPSGELAGVPFEAFVIPDLESSATAPDANGLTYVLDRFETVYGPSSPVLVELAEVAPREDQGRVLVMADPLYPGEGVQTAQAKQSPDLFTGFARRTVPSAGNLDRLTKTRDEALALGRLLLSFEEDQQAASSLLKLEHERSGTVSTELFDLHLGADALPSRLGGDLRQYSILHFAAHGYVDNETPQNTGIALAFTEGQSGYFTVADALELDLDAHLVVLSACETARGKLEAGIGVQSLARAFMYSGTRSVVASLWQVEDTAAAETMTGFYSNFLRGGMAPERALREAKLALRRGEGTRGVGLGDGDQIHVAPSSHPFFWAPFIYLGLPH